MTERLLPMRGILKPTGSIYLHCDPTASHAIKREIEKAGTLKVKGKRYPRLQLLSVPDILEGRRFELPDAPAARGARQTKLPLAVEGSLYP
ncbi:MAG: hypothetical protein M2R45_02392 [Verrucomicrobia subdivision 3 bacterium]|nr:hypothetical protein [Limisphaerales bacterium]